jgi:molecular chaperone DnaK (HSP70)
MPAPALAYATHGGRIATGADARRRAIGSPDRLISRVLHDAARDSSATAGQPADAALATEARADDPVRALRAMVQGVTAAVAAGQGGDPARLTVTHPTPWSAGQVAALADAVRPVIPVGALQLIPTAIAAAVDYTVDHPLADGAAVGVVDVGATGFEAAVVGRRGTELVLLSPRVDHGATGGDQFDDAVLQLVDRAADGAVTALNRATTLQARIARDRLRRDCRLAKETLSTQKAATITAYLSTGTVTVRLTRTAFDDAIRALAEALAETIGSALGGVPAAAGLQAIVLAGGSTQIPLLQRLLARAVSGPLEVARFAAARGAAILAAPVLSDARTTRTAR